LVTKRPPKAAPKKKVKSYQEIRAKRGKFNGDTQLADKNARCHAASCCVSLGYKYTLSPPHFNKLGSSILGRKKVFWAETREKGFFFFRLIFD
jgi:hypothetical protein